MNEKIIVIGTAQNGKGGALILPEDKIPYYLEGLDTWSDEVVGRKIKVTGLLKIEPAHDLVSANGEHTAGISDEKRIISNAEWKLIVN